MAKASKDKQAAPADGSEEPKEKANFVVKSTLIKKMKYIALVDDRYQADLIDEALTKLVSDWEKKNGVIPVK